MPYNIDKIHETLTRAYGVQVAKPALRAELDRVIFVPELDRMIAVSDSLTDLDTTTRYGLFVGMTPKGLYKISSGRWKFARPLTAEEIAKCY